MQTACIVCPSCEARCLGLYAAALSVDMCGDTRECAPPLVCHSSPAICHIYSRLMASALSALEQSFKSFCSALSWVSKLCGLQPVVLLCHG